MGNNKKVTIIFMIVQFTCIPFVSMVINSKVFIRNPDNDGFYFTQNFIKELTDLKNAKRCADFCNRQTGCLSFFYDNSGQKCRLHDSTNFLAFDGISSNGWKFYVVENKECPVHRSFIHEKAEGFCFHVAKGEHSYSYGQLYCSERNSVLVSLQTQQKRIAFSNLIARSDLAPLFGTKILLGLHKTNGVWVWETGETLSASNWNPGQPYCPTGTVCECVGLLIGWTGHTWNDDVCNGKRTVVCEYI